MELGPLKEAPCRHRCSTSSVGGRSQTPASPNRGTTINVTSSDTMYNYGGGHCPTRWYHPPRGPPSTSSSTMVVAATGPVDSTPRGPAIDVFLSYSDGSAGWIPSPFIHSCDIWEMLHATLGVRAPHVHYLDTNMGPRARLLVCVGRTIQ
jgi:hypothetical protein